MARHHSKAEIRSKLQLADQMVAAGYAVGEIASKIGVSLPTYYRWRRQRQNAPSDRTAESEGVEPVAIEHELAALSGLLVEAIERVHAMERQLWRGAGRQPRRGRAHPRRGSSPTSPLGGPDEGLGVGSQRPIGPQVIVDEGGGVPGLAEGAVVEQGSQQSGVGGDAGTGDDHLR